jgi:hypothetical protein
MQEEENILAKTVNSDITSLKLDLKGLEEFTKEEFIKWNEMLPGFNMYDDFK